MLAVRNVTFDPGQPARVCGHSLPQRAPRWLPGTLALLVAASIGGTPANAQDASRPCAARPIPDDSLAVAVEAGRVSITARNVPVCVVVSTIAAEAGLRLEGEVTDDASLTLRIERQRLARVLDRLLGDGGYLLVLNDGDPDARGRLRVLGSAQPSATSTAADTAAATSASAVGSAPGPRTDRRARRDAIERADELDETSALAVLSSALGDADAGVREAAVEALAEMDTSSAREMLHAALQDADAEVRLEVVDTLADFLDMRSTTALEQALTDPDARVREAAAEYLAERADDGSGPARQPSWERRGF